MGKRSLVALAMIAAILIAFPSTPISKTMDSVYAAQPNSGYILVGGQNGTWFRSGQSPRLSQVFLSNQSSTPLTPLPSNGVVWSGSWNGSQWLISGWGSTAGANGSNPYIYLYDGHSQIIASTLHLWREEASWHGGDIFAASYNGSEWLLSGLGSDWLPSGWGSASTGKQRNHLALGLYDGNKFIDFSGDIPNQWDGVLFANAWNGHYWLVGGGWQGNEGVLYRFDGANFTDLSDQLDSAMWKSGRQFDSVQTIGWNGDYWLLGGVGFLAKYDGLNFTDLTPDLNAALAHRYALNYRACCNAVNAVAWDGISWQIGGGAPLATVQPINAWAVSYDGVRFTDLTSIIPSYVGNAAQGSSILTITSSNGSWFFGGYANGRGFLFSKTDSAVADLSGMLEDVTVVNWIGGWPQFSAQTSLNSISSISNYVIVSAAIVVIATALTIRFRKHDSRRRR